MNTEHLSEGEIQLYVLDNNSCEIKIREHVQICHHCRIEIKNYELLFAAIKSQPQASFDFNLAANVLEKLPQPKYSFDNILVFLIAGLAITGMALAFSFYGSNLTSIFSQMAPLVTYLIISTAISIFAFLCTDSYIKFIKQNKKLNYY